MIHLLNWKQDKRQTAGGSPTVFPIRRLLPLLLVSALLGVATSGWIVPIEVQAAQQQAQEERQDEAEAPPQAQEGEKAQEQAPPPEPPSGPTQPAPAPPAVVPPGAPISFRLQNADLLQFLNVVAGELKLNYVVDPAVKGTVNITTEGELHREDLFPILEAVLKINGATAIKTGNFYRVVPLAQAPRIPLEISTDATGEALPQDDRMMMQIIPLRYVSAGDMATVLSPYLSDGGQASVYGAANVLFVVDNSLNLKRLMEILSQFDSPAFAQQRVHMINVTNNVASSLVPELEKIFSAYALSGNTPIRFVPIDRINALLVVTPDPGVYPEVEGWVSRLDQPLPLSGMQTFVYRVENSEADYLAGLLNRILASAPAEGTLTQAAAPVPGEESAPVRVIPDGVNNSLIIQGTPQQYAQIVKTLKELDVVPRQVLIEARVYEVTLTKDLAFGVSYFLQQRSGTFKKGLASFTAEDALQASAGMLIGETRELLGFLNASDNRQRVRVVSAPTVLATDNTEARIQVGTEVPILTSTGFAAGTTETVFNTIQNRDTGIILTVTPRITSTGLVSLQLSQEISAAQAAGVGGSPTFLKRQLSTRAIVQDGDTIALGGLIQRDVTVARNRIPLLGDIPVLGYLFGTTTRNAVKTELIVVLTPRIIPDVPAAQQATRELREKLGEVRRSFKKDKFVNPSD